MSLQFRPRMRKPDGIVESQRRGAQAAAGQSAAAAAFWAIDAENLTERLGSSAGGLAEDEALRRRSTVRPLGHRTASPLRLILSQFRSPITLLLGTAAALSLFLGERTDGLIILAILLASAALGFWQEHRAARAVTGLLSLVESRVSVLRDGNVVERPASHVVPGDVVVLTAGSTIPGDGRLLEEKDLFVDESALSGESFPVEKSVLSAPAEAPLTDRTDAVFFGTHVVSGTGRALVVSVGRDTVFGAIAQRLELRPPQTEFERGVRRFGYFLMEIALLLALVIFAINVALERAVLDAFLFTLALLVGLTPQLLPAIVTTTLAQGARRMAREQVIVRRLGAIEDLGGMTVLCTDKTGTLTEGTVRLGGAFAPGGGPSERARRLAFLNARFESGFANPIDDALRSLPAEDCGGFAKLDEVPYDFVRKRLSVAVMRGTERILITKGAVAEILPICDRADGGAGETVPIRQVRSAVERQFESLSQQGMRCLAVAVRPLGDTELVTKEAENNMELVGLLAFHDPPKQGALEGLRQLRQLGISLKLVTGDNRHVASGVASAAGLDPASLLTGTQLRHLSGASLARAALQTEVFAEVEPVQKEAIIVAIRKAGIAVGYLGDGINDAAALHAADVGISVDSAADVTREAADIVLLRKDLGVLAEGVQEGRRAFANTMKYIFITTSANFGNMFSLAGASLLAPFLPLLPKQVLLINALTDLPAMAIAGDHLDEEEMARPRRWDLGQIRSFMLVFGLTSSIFDFLTFGALLTVGARPVEFRTGWFLVSVLSELVILLVVRTRRVFLRSRIGRTLLWVSCAVGGAAIVLPFLPIAGSLGLGPVSLPLLMILGSILVGYTAASELVKRMFFRRRRETTTPPQAAVGTAGG